MKLNVWHWMLRQLVYLSGITLPAQTPEHCITQGQLQEIQQRSVDDTRMFLSHIGWYYQGQTSDHGWVHESEVLTYHQSVWTNSAGPGGKLKVYHYPGKPNIVVLHTDEVCSEIVQRQHGLLSGTEPNTAGEQTMRLGSLHWRFSQDLYTGYTRQIEILNKAALNKDAAAVKQREAAERAAEAAEEQAYRNKVRDGDLAKAAGHYTKAIAHYREATAMRDDGSLWEPIRYCERMICLYREVRADSAYRAGNYPLALDLYREAIGCSAGKENIQTKIKLVERLFREQQLAEKKKEADRWYQEKRYGAALNVYNEILQMDPGNSYARQRAQEIRLLLEFFHRRSNVTYRYSKMQSRSWNDWKTGLLGELETRTTQITSGYCEARLYVRFDTLGRNKGNTSFVRCSDLPLRGFLDMYSRSAALQPAIENGYFMAADDELRLRYEWKTTNCSISVTGKGEFLTGEQCINATRMTDFLRSEKALPGNYQFTATEKSLNGRQFTDFALTGFENRAVSEGVWRTLLLPGSGARWLSYGTKGKRSSKRFLFFAGMTAGSLLFARASMQQSRQAANPFDADRFKQNARTANGFALFSGAVAGSIYIGEIFRTQKLGRINQANKEYWEGKMGSKPYCFQLQPLTYP